VYSMSDSSVNQDRQARNLGNLYEIVAEIAKSTLEHPDQAGFARRDLERLRDRWTVEEINWIVSVVADDMALGAMWAHVG